MTTCIFAAKQNLCIKYDASPSKSDDIVILLAGPFVEYSGGSGTGHLLHVSCGSKRKVFEELQSNVNGSNTDGSFAMAISNSFLRP